MGLGLFDVIKSAAVDGYFSIILSGIMGIGLLYIFYVIFDYEPDLTINIKITKILGKKFGNFINIIICMILMIIAFNFAYNLNNFIISQFLSETPFIVIGLVFTSLIYYLNTKGIDVISRVSFILTIINAIMLMIAIFGLAPQFDLNNFKPILAYGINRPLMGALFILTINISTIFALFVVPKNNITDKNNTKKYLNISYISSIAVMFVIFINVIGCLGINLASYYQYPEYMVLKRINLFNFLDRIENGIIIQWIFGVFVSISMIIYYISNNINLHSQKKQNIYSLFISILILILGFKIFKNNTIYNNFSYYIAPYLKLLLIIIFTFIALLIKIKKQRK